MFTNACFIRKNTPGLLIKLDELGYVESDNFKNGNCIATSTQFEGGCFCQITEEMFDDPDPHTTWGIKERIDCGDNEELFLAIAALRDDHDRLQWITDGKMWDICRRHDAISYVVIHDIDADLGKVHKATLEELKEHFKK